MNFHEREIAATTSVAPPADIAAAIPAATDDFSDRNPTPSARPLSRHLDI